jgi:two-component system, OmpR family, response regulator CpxR
MLVPRHSTILCVDDEEMALAMRGKVLEAAGYVVLQAGTASQALDLFKNHHVDLVISDHLLPGTTGNDLGRELRMLRARMPILILSGGQMPSSNLRAPDFYLHKLDGPAKMIAKVKSILATHT